MRNWGIDALKVICCLAVVWIHCGWVGIPGVGCAVPCFMFLSFFLSEKIFSDNALRGEIKRRIIGFYVPFVVWGSISWIVRFLFTGNWNLMDLLFQLTFGHVTNSPLYYLFDSIVVFIFFVIAHRFIGRWIVFFSISVIAMSFVLQYSGQNYWMWSQLDSRVSFPVGRICELMPFAAAGLLFARVKRIGKETFLLGVAMLFCAMMMKRYGLFVVHWQFGYAGVFTALAAIGVCVAMISLPSLVVLSPVITNPLRRLAELTAGIYYIHVIVGFIVARFVVNQYVLVLLVFTGTLLLVKGISSAPGMAIAFSVRVVDKKR